MEPVLQGHPQLLTGLMQLLDARLHLLIGFIHHLKRFLEVIVDLVYSGELVLDLLEFVLGFAGFLRSVVGQ